MCVCLYVYVCMHVCMKTSLYIHKKTIAARLLNTYFVPMCIHMCACLQMYVKKQLYDCTVLEHAFAH